MENIRISSLIEPISKKRPTGRNIRNEENADSIYYAIRDTRQRARQIEKKGWAEGCHGDASEDWGRLIDMAQNILQHHSKDLEIIAWLIEGWLRRYGFEGLNQGFLLAGTLIEKYWEQLYPEVDEDGLESKVAAFAGLNGLDNPGSLILPMTMVPITQGNSVGPFVLWQYKEALVIHRYGDEEKQAKRISELGFDLAAIHRAVAESSPAFFEQQWQAVEAAMQSFRVLDRLFTEKCQTFAPPSSYIKATLADILDHLGFLAHEAPFKNQLSMVTTDHKQNHDCHNLENSSNQKTNTDNHQQQQKVDNGVGGLSIQNREQALSVITQAASFYRRMEPHSPIPFLLDRAAYWGTLSLPELLHELIEEEACRNEVLRLTGIGEVKQDPENINGS